MVKRAWPRSRSFWRSLTRCPRSCPRRRWPRAQDAIIATGRSDYPNQVNNVLCFPFIFRGALDVGADDDQRGDEARLRQGARRSWRLAEASEVVAQAPTAARSGRFGPEYLIPRPFDPRLILELAPAVAKAAMKSGVATRPIEDFAAYRQRLTQFVFRSGLIMKPIFERARRDPKAGDLRRGRGRARAPRDPGGGRRGPGETYRRRPTRGGRGNASRSLGLRIEAGPRTSSSSIRRAIRATTRYWQAYHRLTQREGVSPDQRAHAWCAPTTPMIAALARAPGRCGRHALRRRRAAITRHLERYIDNVIGLAQDAHEVSALSLLIVSSGTFFLADTYVTPEPSARGASSR